MRDILESSLTDSLNYQSSWGIVRTICRIMPLKNSHTMKNGAAIKQNPRTRGIIFDAKGIIITMAAVDMTDFMVSLFMLLLDPQFH